MLWLITVIHGGGGVGGLIMVIPVGVGVMPGPGGGLLLAKRLYIYRQQNLVGVGVKNTGPLHLGQNPIPLTNLSGSLNMQGCSRVTVNH